MADTCVDTVLAELSTLEQRLPLISEDSPWADEMVEKIHSCESGLRFLKMFFCSLLTLDDTDDAEIRHIIMPVNHTWEDMWGISSTYKPLDFSPSEITKHAIENWIMDLQDRTQTCMQQFEGSCELLLGYSLGYNPLKRSSNVELLDAVLKNLKDLYKFKTGDEILLINNQIATLENKVTLLHNFFNLTPIQWRDFEEMREFNIVV